MASLQRSTSAPPSALPEPPIQHKDSTQRPGIRRSKKGSSSGEQGTQSPCVSGGRTHGIRAEDISRVQTLIERCVQLYMPMAVGVVLQCLPATRSGAGWQQTGDSATWERLAQSPANLLQHGPFRSSRLPKPLLCPTAMAPAGHSDYAAAAGAGGAVLHQAGRAEAGGAERRVLRGLQAQVSGWHCSEAA